uniref:DUF262 domain-containing protein n=1 Tax=Thermomicrobium roseum TaxID=500 RepID=A0A7C1G635_THERO
MKVSTILDQIDLGTIELPEFQRGYVWNREQVRAFMESLYRRHPVGSLLVWVTQRTKARVRHGETAPAETVHLLLDGQQRITTLYGILRGRPPRFFEGNHLAFTGLFFNVETETFEFYAPLKMKDNPFWISVTELMQRGIGEFVTRFSAIPEARPNLPLYIQRLNRLEQIKEIEFHIDQVTGEDKTIDVVVEIFNKVNSGGTKLSQADLALAKVCVSWPEARETMRACLDKWRRAGFSFRLEWLLRCLNAVVTGEAKFDKLTRVPPDELREGLKRTEQAIDKLLNLISSRLGLDHDRVLGSRYAFPVLARYLVLRDLRLPDAQEVNKLLYWYLHTLLWGRYAGSTETVLNQDLALIEPPEGSLDRLIDHLRTSRGDLRLHPDDFRASSLGARFYPLLYTLARVTHARDWCSGIELSSGLLGKMNQLQVHHIFPKALLYSHGYKQSEVNALANYCFLLQDCNLAIADRAPEEYLEEVAARFPGALESQWVPMDRRLWRIERYRDFLAARRELLAQAANEFLAQLLRGTAPERPVVPPVLEREEPAASRVAATEADRALLDCIDWVREHQLPDGELLHPVKDPETGETVTLDLAWPAGLQEGLSEPVAIVLDQPPEVVDAARRAGFRCFTSVAAFQEYVLRDVLALTS